MTRPVPNVPGLPTSFDIDKWFVMAPERRSSSEEGALLIEPADGPLAPMATGLATQPAIEPSFPGTAEAATALPPANAPPASWLVAEGGAGFAASLSPVDVLAEALAAPLLVQAEGQAPAAGPQHPSASPVGGGARIMVQWAADATEADRTAALGGLGGLRKELIHTVPMRARGDGVLEVIELPLGANVQTALATYQAMPQVRFAEVDQLLQVQSVSNDSEYRNGQLWGMYGSDSPSSHGPANTTNEFGSNAEAAWNQGFTGSKSVVVGILDDGIDYAHEDLAANMWLNPYETQDGIDNDGNGYIDDIRGWNFYDNNNATYNANLDFHATHVAGTIGGVGGNGRGVAGVNWDVSMISARFLDGGSGFISGAILALDYITDLKWRHGLNIVATNNSWTGGGNSQAMQEAIVRSAQQDILFVTSAGNQSSDNDLLPSYPTAYDTTPYIGYDAVISVAAINRYGQLADFSNYGNTAVDLGAPGVDILSSLPRNYYYSLSGTSMAAPHVTGAVALYASRYPGSTAEQIRTALLASTIPTPSLEGITASGGRLDVLKFLNTVVAPAFSIAASQAYLAEGESGLTLFQFKITRHGDQSGQQTVSWGVTGTGEAPADGNDFSGEVLPGGTVTFAPGVSSTLITVPVTSDTAQEGMEAFSVTLNNPSDGATLATANKSASSMILNDDGVLLAFNPAAIVIPSIGSSNPFPSSLTVTSASGLVATNVEVTLYNFYHNSFDDVDILLVGPTGAKTLLLSDGGGENSVAGVTLTFSAQATAEVPDEDPLSSGSWRPMNHYSPDYDLDAPSNDVFNAQAPAGPYLADLSVFNGTNPNGVWRLFVQDDNIDAAGKIMDGWSLSINTQSLTASVSLAVSTSRVLEDGPANLVYTFTRSGPLTNPLSVNYSVSGSAQLGTDYSGIAATPASKSVSFAAGAATATVTVDPITDGGIEADETVTLTLLEGTDYTLGTVGAVTGMIQDDDTQILEAFGNTRLMRDAGGRLYAQAGNSVPAGLRFRGRPILQTGFVGWEPLTAENLSGVNQMIWKSTSGNYLSLWTMDSSWNWISSTGEWGLSSPGAFQHENNFGMDFNGNGIIGAGLGASLEHTLAVPLLQG